MKTLLSGRYLLLLSRFVLGTVFIVASIDKIALPVAFESSLEAYRLLPYWSVPALALVIPWLELVSGLLLLTGTWLRGGALIIGVLLIVFIAAISSALFRNLSIDCGCFGAGFVSPVSWVRVGEDALLLLMAIHVHVFSPLKQGPGLSPE